MPRIPSAMQFVRAFSLVSWDLLELKEQGMKTTRLIPAGTIHSARIVGAGRGRELAT